MSSPMSAGLLLILDGYGSAQEGPGNALCRSRTPVLDALAADRPTTTLACSGRAVGLPEGFMGNSEVGHMNIGAGRVVYQDMTRIDMAIEDGSFFKNPAFVSAMQAAKGAKLHLMGLVSDGGVHSHQNHIYALLEMARQNGVGEVCVHAFLDGRDTPPTSGAGYVESLTAKMAEIGIGRVATVMGRYWAMDRDQRWDRNRLAYRAMTLGEGEMVQAPVQAIHAAYGAGETDEFVKPRIIAPEGVSPATVDNGDALIFFNFRADRARQISRLFFDPDFGEFEREKRPRLSAFATMTRYAKEYPMEAAFPPISIDHTLGQTVSEAGLSQLRIAETEKYAHVTYFLNCGREEPFPGEERKLVPSPREVATYDQKPEMSAREVAAGLISAMESHDLCVCNLANLDMVGHTGIIDAAMAACETVDACVAEILDEVARLGRWAIVTADHGNSEEMLDASGNPQTAHSLNPVPLHLVLPDGERAVLRSGGKLGDIAPTVLELMGLAKPEAMTGTSLVASRGGEG